MSDISVVCECGNELDIYTSKKDGYTGIILAVKLCKACWEAAKQEARDEMEAGK